ncbi:MAG: 30S ribosomal protein S8e [Candidatus Aenigmarchaeota archaeon]|nr:30S ribosomal protein S8e [Candidatus Aenigmarchaeota archaeon]
MAQWHLRSRRKPTGGLLNRRSKKKKHQRGSVFLETSIGGKEIRVKRTKGGGQKAKVLVIDRVNVASRKSTKITPAKILSVTDNPANPHYIRRNIITKGAIVKTDIGSVRITSRPGQDGSVNGVLVEEKK